MLPTLLVAPRFRAPAFSSVFVLSSERDFVYVIETGTLHGDMRNLRYTEVFMKLRFNLSESYNTKPIPDGRNI